MTNPIKKSPSASLFYLPPMGGGGGGGGNVPEIIPPETMRRRASSAALPFVLFSLFLFLPFSLYYTRHPIFVADVINARSKTASYNLAIADDLRPLPHSFSSSSSSSSIRSVSVLLPDWEVLVIVLPDSPAVSLSGEGFVCLYPNNATSPARFSGILPSTNQASFKCELPRSSRRPMPFLAPLLTRSPEKESPVRSREVMLRWTSIAVESFSTDDDVVLFVKGLNHRQGINRSPSEFKCVFSDDTNNNVVKTAVTSSIQEVFRCRLPDLTALGYAPEDNDRIKLKVSIEILDGNWVIPTVAYYTPRRKVAELKPKSQLCACTMVYNAAKFLREWVMYHSRIGVDKFILYDNGSDDDLQSTVEGLNGEGFNVETRLWVWPKTQEAGFSHAALYGAASCTWMMYIDVDEFVFGPSWSDSPRPSDQMLKSLLPKIQEGRSGSSQVTGQVSIRCNEFGPSSQRSHPAEGVTQGYTCRRRVENRHKSIVLLEAIDDSLFNAIHHFQLKEKYRGKKLSLGMAVVNHYKYQAWSEFKAKFRRRVSAYVVDWRQALNPLSKDRTPGLGFKPVEPQGWEKMFCEVFDERLKLMTRRWFGRETETGYRMEWQR